MSPKRFKNGMKPSLYPVQISKILPKPLPRLFLDPSYGPAYVWNKKTNACLSRLRLDFKHKRLSKETVNLHLLSRSISIYTEVDNLLAE